MTIFTKILRGMLGCALMCSLLPLCAYAENTADASQETEEALMKEVRENESSLGFREAPVQGEASLIRRGSLGENLTWEYWDDATLRIKGAGQMPDYGLPTDQPWNEYLTLIEHVIVEEGVERIGDRSFYNANQIASVELPFTLEGIGSWAFYRNEALSSMQVPDSVTTIGEGAFSNCLSLTTCHLPRELTEISTRLFESCRRLQNVNLPNALTKIGAYAFNRGSTMGSPLESFAIPSAVTEIGTHAFYNLVVKGDVVIPVSFAKMRKPCDLTKLIIQGTMRFEEGITDDSIRNATWNECSAKCVSIPASLTWFPNVTIAEEAYIVSDENPVYTSVDGSLFSKNGQERIYESKSSVLVAAPNSALDYFVSEGTVEIGARAFGANVPSVHVPASVEAIAAEEETFGSKNLRGIAVAQDNDNYASVGGILYDGDRSELIRCPRKNEFNDGVCEIPDDVKTIRRSAFENCDNLVTVRVSSGVTCIPERCFYECRALVCLYVPKSVSRFENEACYVSSWPHLERTGVNVFYEGTEEEWGTVSIAPLHDVLLTQASLFFDIVRCGVSEDHLLYYLESGGVLQIVPDDKLVKRVTMMADYDAGEPAWMDFEESIKEVVFSQRIKSVGARAFAGCTALEKVTLPPSILCVGSGSFVDCPRLTHVECCGEPFEAKAQNEEGASFGSGVELFYRAEALGWIDAPAYDETARTWNGYRLSLSESSEYLEIGSILLTREGQEVDNVMIKGGYAWGNAVQTKLDVTVLSKDGIDITSRVSITVDYPKNQRRLAKYGSENKDILPYSCVYDDRTKKLEVGCCATAGLCKVKAAPKEFITSGEPVECSLALERDQERIYDSTWYSQNQFRIIGRMSNALTEKISLDVWNQFGESVSDRCAIQVIDAYGNIDITDRLDEFGIIMDGFAQDGYVRYSQLAIPRNYRFVFTPPPNSMLTGSAVGYFTLKRDETYFDLPFSLELTGGDDRIELSEDSVWAKTPYRLSILDCYDNPCWPDVSWTIKDMNGVDVTEQFRVDEQGYLFMSNGARALLKEDGSSTPFTICSVALGYKNAKRTSNELPFSMELKPAEPPLVFHTATFKVGDDEVARVAFAEGDVALEEPAVPQRDNYVGTWEEYDLASATGDIVVEGRYTPLDPDAVSDIELGGDAVYEDGAVTINLAASASSKQVRIQSTQTKPLDVVLVCDQSGSMGETLGSGEKKVDALKRCAKEFVTALYENADKTGADHRVSLVGFACSDTNNNTAPNIGGYKNTGILVTSTGGFKKYGSEARGAYGEALLPVSVNGRINQRLYNGIDQIAAEGATAADCGLNLAKGIFAANSNLEGETVRERVVVFITDGVPTDWNVEADRLKSTGANAITIAKDIKQGQGAHIYSIGVDAEANPAAAFSSSSSGVVSDSKKDIVYDFNRFLHAVSSNYPDAAAMGSLGDGSKSAGYYMAVNDTANLNRIFSSILYSTVYTVESFDRATLSYTLPAGFVLTLKQEEEMREALAGRGLTDDDIVVSEANGATTIVFKNVKVKDEYENGVQHYVARVSFRVSAGKDATGSVAAGSASVNKSGDVVECVLSDVVIPQDRCVLVFEVNNAIYEIRDAAMGDVIELPDTDIARWMDLEKKNDPKVDSTYAVFKTTTLDRAYTLRWVVDGEEQSEIYAPGEAIRVPEQVEDWIPEDKDLIGWAPSLPTTMPTRNVVCTAVLTPKHEHSYTAFEYMVGSCTEHLEVHRTCICGDDITVKTMPTTAHKFNANLGCTGNSKALTVEELVCETCGFTINKHITYKVSKSQWGGRNTTVINMSKYNGTVLQDGFSTDKIEMRFYIGTSFYDQSADYVVTRIDENGKETTYTTKLKNGYLVFDPDHFSVYAIGEKDPTTDRSVLSGMSYDEALFLLANPDPDEEPSGGPEETAVAPAPIPGSSPNAPEVPDRGSSDNGSHDAGGWDTNGKSIGALVNTTITSSEGVDLSLRSPKTGQIALGRSFMPLLKKRARAA